MRRSSPGSGGAGGPAGRSLAGSRDNPPRSARSSEAEAALPIILILVVASIDWIWSRAIAVQFVGWSPVVAAVAFLAVIATVYRTIRSAPPLVESALYGALWVAFTAMGCAMTYLAASLACPLADKIYAAIDLAIGFDWLAWAGLVQSYPAAEVALRAAYGSLLPQIAGSILVFAIMRVPGRNQELLTNAIIALLFTAAISAVWPALGPWVHFGYDVKQPADVVYVPDVLALRRGGPLTFALSHMQGIVCFPSYHTILAILLVHAHRGLRWSLPTVLAVNLLMLLSLPAQGGHYLSDIFGGACVAFGAVAVTSHIRAITGVVHWRRLPQGVA